MIIVKCKESEEAMFSRCIAYECTNETCEDCKYYDCNISFEHVDKESIEILSSDEIDIKVCNYNTFYNYPKCEMGVDCDKCRFYYDNIKIKIVDV